MVKVITFIKRKAGMPVEEFQGYWLTRHPGVVTRLPGVRRYVQSHALLSLYEKSEPAYDGIAEVWADDTGALRAMTQSPAHADVQADEARFIDRTTIGVIITEDHVTKDGELPREPVKSVALIARKPGLSVEEFQRHWLEVHGPIAEGLPGLRRYVQSHTRRSAYEAGRVPAYDGAVLMWFDSTDVMRSAEATPQYARVLADAATFLDVGRVRSILTREHVIVAQRRPPAAHACRGLTIPRRPRRRPVHGRADLSTAHALRRGIRIDSSSAYRAALARSSASRDFMITSRA